MKFGSKQTKPGEAVSINVKASPFSQVGLLAVDKSVLLLDEGNDFSVSQVKFSTQKSRRGRHHSARWSPLVKQSKITLQFHR